MCISLHRSLNIFTYLSYHAVYLQHLSKFLLFFFFSKSIIFLPCSSHSVHFCIFFLAKSSAFGLFVHSSHGSSCSIKENIFLLNAPSSGTYGVWRPVNGVRLEALRNKTFRDEFSISPGSFTPWWISGCCSFIRRCNCGTDRVFCLELERWFRNRWRHGRGTNAFLSFTATWTDTFQQLEWVNIQINQ